MAGPSPRDLFRNFSAYDARVHEKIRLALSNTWKKVRTRSECCGNHGQPGC
jgi:hypothetical protein